MITPECLTDDSHMQFDFVLRFHLHWLDDNRLLWGEFDGDEHRVYYDFETGMYEYYPVDSSGGDAGNIGFSEFQIWEGRLIYVGGYWGSFTATIPDYPVEGETYRAHVWYYDEETRDDYYYVTSRAQIIQGNEREYIGLYNGKQEWHYIDPDIPRDNINLAEIVVFEEEPILRLNSADENPVYWHVGDVMLDEDGFLEHMLWEFVAPERVPIRVETVSFRQDRFAIAPDNERAAYLDENGIHVLEYGGIFTIPGTDAVSEFVWGNVGWYVDD